MPVATDRPIFLSIGALRPRVESATLSCTASGKISTRSEPKGEEGLFAALKRRKNSVFLRAFKGRRESPPLPSVDTYQQTPKPRDSDPENFLFRILFKNRETCSVAQDSVVTECRVPAFPRQTLREKRHL
jgi:hypothetical protein